MMPRKPLASVDLANPETLAKLVPEEFTSTVLPKGVTMAQFILVWQSNDSAKVVGELLGMEGRKASQFAGFLRKKGVPLRAGRVPQQLADYEKLKHLAEIHLVK